MPADSKSGHGYGELTYWNERYKAEQEKYDWYLSYSDFRQHFHKLLYQQFIQHDNQQQRTPTEQTQDEPNDYPTLISPSFRQSLRILIVGCGNSELSFQLLNDGFTHIHSVDYSPIVIEKMQQLYMKQCQQYREFIFSVQDVRSMNFTSGSFDVVIDKGTLDAILCGADSARNSTLMLNECRRVLNRTVDSPLSSSVMLIITYGNPSTRLTYLEKSRLQWNVTVEQKGENRYFYTCTTNGETVE